MAQNLSNLPIGAKVKFGKHSVNGETAQSIIWLVVAKNHGSTPAYPANSVTLLTEKIIDMRAYDAVEPTNTVSGRRAGGNSHYALSNIHQWLNSNGEAGKWFTASHVYDASPNNERTTRNTGYDGRPGFLHFFTQAEQSNLISTTLRSMRSNEDYGGYHDISAKVFLPSLMEIMGTTINEIPEGARWAYFNSNSAKAVVTSQVATNTTSATRVSNGASLEWWLRTPYYNDEDMAFIISENGEGGTSASQVRVGDIGVRPVINLPSTLSISDTTDSDGCYTAVWNSAPPVPTTLNVPTIYGGKSSTISWGKVSDPDGHTVTYQLEQSLNGGAYTALYSGANLSFTTVVPAGSTTIQFRLKAVDSMGASSGYITSTSRTVVNNTAPMISGSNGSLGVKNSGFTQTYNIADTENNPVTVTESIDGVQVRSYVNVLGTTNTFSVEGNTWVALANGNHTLTITATDGIDSSTRTYTFTKSVSSFTVQNSTPMSASTRPTRIKVSVNRTIPPEATMKIEVCNNGFDSSPTWEDATQSMKDGLVYLFSNTTKTATNWGVRIRVTVNRNGGSGACYVTSIGGNWE